MSINLTQEELKEITGYVTPKFQKQWLALAGFVFKVSATGRPIVSRDHYIAIMGGSGKPASKRTEPNWNAA